jgi:hypothetical protein
MLADPFANGLIGMSQRCARHKFLARAEIDVRHGVGVRERGHPKIEDHHASLASP